jgi:hypothetical protein
VKYLIPLLAFCITPVIANSSSVNLSMPSASSSSGYDKVKMGTNDCQNSIAGATTFEVGLMATAFNAIAPLVGKEDLDNPQTKDISLYARISIPLDAPPERVNCSTLYKLMLQKERLEVEKLRQEIELLKQMQTTSFEN